MMIMIDNEECWVLVGDSKDDLWWARARKRTVGTPASVGFDAQYVTKIDTETRSIVGMLHSHPGMKAIPSSRDDRTMHAWVCSLGKNLVCLIRGIDGLRAWWYVDDESPAEEYQVGKQNGLYFGVTPALYYDSPSDANPERLAESRP